MNFIPERLITLRNSLNINKAEAARRLNISAMGYGRYESGEREPSYQTVCFIAHTFHSTPDYLYGLSDTPSSKTITLLEYEDPELFSLVQSLQSNRNLIGRLSAYVKYLQQL